MPTDIGWLGLSNQTWHGVEWFMEYFANPLASVILVGVTGWYAWTTQRILRANRDLVDETAKLTRETAAMATETRTLAAETRRMADATQRTYLASVAPEMEFDYNGAQSGADRMVVSLRAHNRGKQRVIVVRVGAVGATGTPLAWNPPESSVLIPGGSLDVRAELMERTLVTESIYVEVEDIAGQRHRLSPHGLPRNRHR